MASVQPSEKLSFSTRMLYGSGTIAFGVKDQGFNALLMLFYNQVIGLPAAWVGSAIMIAMIADAIFDPMLGQYSDNIRTRWGRRHPFMYAAALPIAAFYLLLWSPPQLSDSGTFAWLVTSAILVRFAISLYEIPSTALLAEFTNDYDERTKLVAARYFFGVCGGILMTIITFGYFLKPSASQPVGHLNASGYSAYAWAAAAIMAAAVLISSFGTQKRALMRPSPPPVIKLPFFTMLKEMGRVMIHPAYISILLASLFFAVAAGLSLSLQVYFATYFWELSAAQIATMASSTIIGIILAFVVVLPLSARFGKKPAAIIMYLLAMLATATPLILRLLGHFPANGDPALLWVLMGFLAFSMMTTVSGGILAVSMVADVTDQIQLETGKRSEGLLFSAATMVSKAVSGMGIMMAGLLLAFVGFPEQAQPGQVSDAALNGLAKLFILANSAASICAVICLGFYPISRSRHLENVQRLAQQNAA